jgi:hypothetical protein
MPWATCNMRRKLYTSLVATDATPTSGGSCRARVSKQLARTLFAHSVRKGGSARLDGSELPGCEEKGGLQSDFIDGLGEKLKWHVSKSYSFRRSSHINLQELRALAVEARDWTRPSWAGGHYLVQLGLCDSQVVIGAIGKGRSSSYKLNGIMRGMLGNCLVTGNSWALSFIGTHWNPGDYPSRRKPLPSFFTDGPVGPDDLVSPGPGAPDVCTDTATSLASTDYVTYAGSPSKLSATSSSTCIDTATATRATLAPVGAGDSSELPHSIAADRDTITFNTASKIVPSHSKGQVARGSPTVQRASEGTIGAASAKKFLPSHSATPGGLEVFSGGGRLTQAHLAAGMAMHPPVELQAGLDAFDPLWEAWLLAGLICWLWLAPPCSSFSPLRNLDPGGPLRPRGLPYGPPGSAEARLGNSLWRRALFLARLAHQLGIPVTIEHPQRSLAWRLKESQRLIALPGFQLHTFDHCMYSGREPRGSRNKKTTQLLTTAPWAASVCRRCDGRHPHTEPLRGKRAKAAGQYPEGFCSAWAAGCCRHGGR